MSTNNDFLDDYIKHIKTWNVDTIVEELDLIRVDFDEGLLDEKTYTDCVELLNGELRSKIHNIDHNENYKRAMTGI